MAIVYKMRMPDGVPSRTDGVDIYLDDRLDDIAVRCQIVHEQIHIERGHSTLQTEAVEMSVRYETAIRLLPLDKIVGVCKKGRSLASVARELQVTKQVLMDRAATLTDAQAQLAGCLDCRLCPVIQARYTGHPSATRRHELATV